jgi:methionine-rich copper-binding protein CopC
MKRTIFGLAGLIGSAALLATSPAWAHTSLVSSNPAANATVSAAPKTITLTFSAKVAPAFSKFELVMPEHGGMKVPVKTTVSQDGKSIVGTVSAPLAKGGYKIAWTVASADGHKMNGEVPFTVG